MIGEKFKVLVWDDMFVDENLLDNGIYFKSVPTLHPENTTMESYTNNLKVHRQSLEGIYNIAKILENLKECSFITYKLIKDGVE